MISKGNAFVGQRNILNHNFDINMYILAVFQFIMSMMHIK